jgi:glyoxylase-like metal-dependent hydrolase (beta-lactamase superfamily II)
MHVRTAQLMRARCQGCLDNLREVVGDVPMQGTEMYTPDQTFDATHTLALIGRPVRVHHFGHSSGPGDVAVLDEASGVLFAGGMLDAGRIPDIQDSDLPGWHAALAALRGLPVKTIVPGHGPASAPALVDENRRYLDQLGERMRAFVAAGGSLLGAPEAAELPEFAGWDQYDLIHHRNASIAFLRFERELMFK